MILRAALMVLALAGTAEAQGMAEAGGALLRGLDKIAGTAVDLELSVGQTLAFGQLQVTLNECRFPAEDPSSNAFARLTIFDSAQNAEIFSGWMIADSPALSALDHQRYDVWVIRCKSE
ncbi:DUF2155 domain-containing protein [Phaeovulum sp.]|uniref:DUF2155 domain-containing protein n=1 Tax=Phaeovulum sp. TaxID=2934796 RepID=UPI0039E3B859